MSASGADEAPNNQPSESTIRINQLNPTAAISRLKGFFAQTDIST